MIKVRFYNIKDRTFLIIIYFQGSFPAHRQPVTSIVAQPEPQGVKQFTPLPTTQDHIQIAPQIFVPDAPAGGSNTASNNSPTNNDFRIPMVDETQESEDVITG